jgi:hypothetical protein
MSEHAVCANVRNLRNSSGSLCAAKFTHESTGELDSNHIRKNLEPFCISPVIGPIVLLPDPRGNAFYNVFHITFYE